jgi:hypothetical protein
MRRFILSLFIAILLFASAEFAARAYVRAVLPAFDDWLPVAPAFRDAPFAPGRYPHPSSRAYGVGSRTIWMIGDSTLGDGSTPDEYTLAYRLMQFSNWRINVDAEGGQGIVWAFDQLKQTSIQPGDKVVFYIGADASVPYWRARDIDQAQPALCAYDSVLYDVSALYLLACKWRLLDTPPSLMQDARWLDGQAHQIAALFNATAERAAQYAEGKGAVLTVILHPYVWTAPLSPAERMGVVAIRHNMAIGASYNAVYPLLNGVDLSHVLDDARAQGANLYIDAYHVTWRGDELMTRAVYNVLFPIL